MIDDNVLSRYAKAWKQPRVYKDLRNYLESNDQRVEQMITPRGVQIEALYAIESSRRDGAERALVQAATGAGKTYIAAFDSKAYQRVLLKDILDYRTMYYYRTRYVNREKLVAQIR